MASVGLGTTLRLPEDTPDGFILQEVEDADNWN